MRNYTVRVGAQDEDGIHVSAGPLAVSVGNVVPTLSLGGDDRDFIRGGQGNNLRIGGSTGNEGDVDRLRSAIDAWFEGDLVTALLELGPVVDSDQDHLRGNSDRDRFIGGSSDRIRR